MKRLLLLLPLLFAPMSAKANWNYELEVGQCVETSVENITARWGSNFYKYGAEDPIIEFANDISLYPYRARLREDGKLDTYGSIHIEVVKHVFGEDQK